MDVGERLEQELLGFIREAEQEQQKLELRLATAKRSLEDSERRLAGLKLSLDMVREKYGLAKDEQASADPTLAARYSNKSTREILLQWAREHEHEVVMKDISRQLAAAGLWPDERQASGALYAAIGRMDEFRRTSRGHYKLRGDTPQSHQGLTVTDTNQSAAEEDLEDLPF